MKNWILTIVALLILPLSVFATHIVTTNLTTECLGGNQYLVTLEYYRDCGGISAGTQKTVNVESALCGSSFSANLPLVSATEISPICPGLLTECNGGTLPGIELVVFQGIITLPNNCFDWIVSANECCRQGANSLASVTSQSMFAVTQIDNSNGNCNSNAEFGNSEIQYACAGEMFVYTPDAVDPDGNDLEYSLISVLGNGGAPISWNPGFSTQNPFGATYMDFESSTGRIVAVIPNIGNYLVNYRVNEYQNGVLVGSFTREVSVTVTNCTNASPTATNTVADQTLVQDTIYMTANDTLNLSVEVTDPDVADVLSLGNGTLLPSDNAIASPFTFSQGATANVGNAQFQFHPTSTSDATYYYDLHVEDDECLLATGEYFKRYVIMVQSGVTTPQGVSDTMTMPAIYEGGTSDFCFVWNSTYGGTTGHTNLCPPQYGSVASWGPNNDTCFTYTAGNVTQNVTEELCIEVCHTNGVCDTHVVYIPIQMIDTLYMPVMHVDSTLPVCVSNPTFPIASYTVNCPLQYGTITQNGNCLEYMPDGSGIDVTEELCITICPSAGVCLDFVVYIPIGSCVWAGDTDTSQVVNNFDLLPLGFAMGANAVGDVRPNADINFDCEPAINWVGFDPGSGANFKHCDTDGNGIAEADDTTAIIANWGQMYQRSEITFLPGNVPFYLLPSAPSYPSGSVVDVAIMLGDMVDPAIDAYGVAFTFNYDATLIEDNTVMADFSTSWLGQLNNDMIQVQRDFSADGRIEMAITRTDGMPMTGYGQIGNVAMTIKDDIIRSTNTHSLDMYISNVRILDIQGAEIGINPSDTTVTVIDTTTGIQPIANSQYIEVYPNPVTHTLHIQSPAQAIRRVEVYNALGQLSYVNENENSQIVTMNVMDWTEGIYFIQIHTENLIYTETVKVN